MANSLKAEAMEECEIVNKPPFECAVASPKDDYEVLLYDEAGTLVSQSSGRLFAAFSEVMLYRTASGLVGTIVPRVSLQRKDIKEKDVVEVEQTYCLTLPMCEAVISALRTDMELGTKKIEKKQAALEQAINSISVAFPHIAFSPEQSCFFYREKVDAGADLNGQALRQAAVEQNPDRRSGCCCLLL